MELDVAYRGRTATTEDVALIERLIDENPSISRRGLSQKLCVLWNWRQPNGVLRDMVCRGFLLQLERSGHIKLPPHKCKPNNPFVNREKSHPLQFDTSEIIGTIKELSPFTIKQVRRSRLEHDYNNLVAQYHYLGYCQPVGEHLKYVIYCKDRPIACLAFSSAPRHIGCRDRFIGWSAQVRRNNIDLIAYNTRFLVVPWAKVPHLASHVLSAVTRQLSRDWSALYNHPVAFIETFVDTQRFKGTCYKAANWIYLGLTTGRGKADQTKRANRSLKAVWGYPLTKNFRCLLIQ